MARDLPAAAGTTGRSMAQHLRGSGYADRIGEGHADPVDGLGITAPVHRWWRICARRWVSRASG